MSQPKGSVGVAITMAVIIVVAVSSVGYYQFVYCPTASCSTSTTTSTSSGPACAPPACLTIDINFGAATLTTTAYSPDVVTMVIGVNNTFQVYNNDSESGGVFHSLTADSCAQSGQPCPFDTGVIGYGVTKGPFTITKPGTYPYYCVVHPTTMRGTIIVKAGSGSSSGSAAATSTTSSGSASGQTGPALTNTLAISILKGAATNPNSPGFSPDVANVVLGVNNTIVWTNNDVSGQTVTFTSTPTGADVTSSNLIAPGATFVQTLTVPGTYHYISTLNTWMKGTIVVKSA